MKLLHKLVLGFGAMVLIVAASSIFVYWQTVRLAEIERMNAVSDQITDSIDRLKGDLASARASLRKEVLTGAASDQTQFTGNFEAFKSHLAGLEGMLEKNGSAFLPDLAAFQHAAADYAERSLFVEARLAGSPATRPQAMALVATNVSAPHFAAVNKTFDALRGKIVAWSDEWTAAANVAMARMIWVVVSCGILCIVVSIAMAWLIAVTLGRPIVAMTDAMRALAKGDIQVDVPARGQTDEIGEMADAVQVFKEAALAKRQLELETAEERRAVEDERVRNEATRADAARQMSKAVDGLAEGLKALAAGDLVSRLDTAFAPDYEMLRRDYNAAVEQLQATLKTVSANADSMRSGTGEISAASDDLARRTEQQAATLEETAAALDHITTNVRKTADSAAQARDAVKKAQSDASRSGEVVAATIAAMTGIATSSREIGQIITVIDEIAFQTNLLALNAGVEAARAGDAGRGFAVVASEVRALAQRSAEAAREIKTLILNSGSQVETGVGLVAEAGTALTRMSAQIAAISGAVTEIAGSTQEQASSLAEVNVAIGQMDKVTQQNAAMVEESTAAAHHLATDADVLARLVGRFEVGAERASERRAPRVVERREPPVRSARRASAAPAVKAVTDDWEEF